MNDQLVNFVIENPVLIRDQVYDRIKREILFGRIPPGARVLEGRLANRLKVSRTPVREALHALEMEGFVESFPRVGYRVREITWKEVVEIHEIRAALEPMAAKKAIESGDRTYIEALERAVALAEIAARQEQPDSFFQEDARFDEIIIRASGMDTLLGFWITLRHRLTLFRMRARDDLKTRHRAVEGHRKIIECLRNGDREAVTRAILAHLEDSRKDMQRMAFDG